MQVISYYIIIPDKKMLETPLQGNFICPVPPMPCSGGGWSKAGLAAATAYNIFFTGFKLRNQQWGGDHWGQVG